MLNNFLHELSQHVLEALSSRSQISFLLIKKFKKLNKNMLVINIIIKEDDVYFNK